MHDSLHVWLKLDRIIGRNTLLISVNHWVTLILMLATIRHKGLEAFYRMGAPKGLPQKLVKCIAAILPALDVAQGPEDLTLPGLRLHPLKVDLRDYWSVSVSGNWRLIFRFKNKAVYDLDLVDYHGKEIAKCL